MVNTAPKLFGGLHCRSVLLLPGANILQLALRVANVLLAGLFDFFRVGRYLPSFATTGECD